jgi:hypothetical protein
MPAGAIVWLWNLDLTEVAARVCGLLDSALTPAEWNSWIAGPPYLQICA